MILLVQALFLWVALNVVLVVGWCALVEFHRTGRDRVRADSRRADYDRLAS